MDSKDKTDVQSVETGRKMLGIFSDMSDELYAPRDAKLAENGPESKRNLYLKRFGAGVLIAFAVAGGVSVGSYATRQPNFSSSTTEYKVEKGDGIWDAASHIQGIDTVDRRDVIEHIKEMPQNTETLKDGLQPGETLITPKSVSR